MKRNNRVITGLLVLAMSLLVAWPLEAQNLFNVAVNPVTNTIYATDCGSTCSHTGNDNGEVVVADAATGLILATITPSGAVGPVALAVNTITNKIYVANWGSGNVTVIDGNNLSASPVMVSVGTKPVAVAVNPVTNKAYVANYGSGNATVIDANYATTTVTGFLAGDSPLTLAVNPVTNKIYVANTFNYTVTVIDGSSDTVLKEFGAGNVPGALAVNPVTNKIYVLNIGALYSPSLMVVDGQTDSVTATIGVGSTPNDVAVNPVTNKIYVANCGSQCWTGGNGSVTVVDGASNATATVTDPNAVAPYAVAVDPVSNKIYVANLGDGGVTNNGNVTVIDGATDATTTLPSMNSPTDLAVNPVTNKVYVANSGSGTITQLDGATNATTTITDPTASLPLAVAVNPVTNKTYVANSSSGNVTVIDGSTHSVSATVGVGSNPVAVAVNPVTNQTYVANKDSNNVTVIDANNGYATTTVTDTNARKPMTVAVNPVTNKIYVANEGDSGATTWGNVTVINGATGAYLTTVTDLSATAPVAVAVNPATNRIYVANFGSSNVTVIDGATDLAISPSVSVGSEPVGVAVNPIINRIYVANSGSNNATIIDGVSNTAVNTVGVGTSPQSVAVDPLNNKVYVANSASGNVTVFPGDSGSPTTTLLVGTTPMAVAFNSSTNKIYVANNGDVSLCGNVTVIDGVHNTVTGVTDPNACWPVALAINPVTNTIYVANKGSGNVTAITEQQVWPIPLWASITPLPGNATGNLTPSFNFTAASAFAPFASPPDNLLFQVDTWQEPWTAATHQGNGAFSGVVDPPLQQGFHILYAFSTDGQDATSTHASTGWGAGLSPLISDITAYGFLVALPTATLAPPTGLNFGNQMQGQPSAERNLTLSNLGGPLTVSSIGIGGANPGDFSEIDDCPMGSGTLAGGASCTISVTFTPSTLTAESATLTVHDDSGGSSGATQTADLSGTGALAATTTSITAPTITYPGSASVTVTVTSGEGTPTGNVSLSVDSVAQTPQTLSSGSAVFTINGLGGGSHSLSAIFPAQGDFAASSATGTLYVRKAQPTVSLNNVPGSAAYRSTFMPVATTNARTAATLSVSGVCSIANLNTTGTTTSGTVTMTSGTGTCTVDANWPSDNNYLPASLSPSLTATLAPTTTSIAAHTPNPSVVGQGISVTYTVSVAPLTRPATGTVTVSDGTDTCVASVAAGGCTLTPTMAGAPLTLIATYSGDSNYATSATSSGVSQTVNKAGTKTTITAWWPDPSVVGQTAWCSFTVKPVAPGSGTPTGNVTVSDSAGDTCTAAVATGQCSMSFPAAGSKTLKAKYVGDSNFNSSTSAGVTQNVTDFSISARPTSQWVDQGLSASITITIAPLDGFTGSVALSCGGVPAGATCTFSKSPVSLTSTSGSVSSTATIKTKSSTPTGNYTLTFTGNYGSGVLTHSVNVPLKVTP